LSVNKRINALEAEIEARYNELSELRAKDEPLPLKDYDFTGPDGKNVRLSKLFGPHDSLILVHNMGRQCPYCTIWADGFSDSYHRVSQKTAFVVTSRETVEEQQRNIKERGWQFPMVSSRGNRILEDLGFLEGDTVYPGLAYFTRDEHGEILYHSKHVFGSGDQFGMLWHLFDLVNKWDPAEFQKPRQ